MVSATNLILSLELNEIIMLPELLRKLSGFAVVALVFIDTNDLLISVQVVPSDDFCIPNLTCLLVLLFVSIVNPYDIYA